MELQDLRIFLAVARTCSMTRAARELHTVQSNVSSRIQVLEKELNAVLLRRHARGVALTSAGEQLLPYARRIERLVDEAQRVVADPDHPAGPLRIGSLETTAGLRLPAALAAFTAECPDVDLTLSLGGTDGLVREVLDHRLDGALVTGPVQRADLEATPVFTERLVVVTAPSVTDVDALIDSAEQLSVLVFREGCSYRRRLEEYVLARTATAPRIREFGTLEGILGCVGAGMGITMLPRAVVREHGRVRAHRLPRDLAHAETVFVRRRDVPTTAALRRFLDHVMDAGPPARAVPGDSAG